MAEFVEIQHNGIEGTAHVAKSALERLPDGWKEVPASKSTSKAKKADDE